MRASKAAASRESQLQLVSLALFNFKYFLWATNDQRRDLTRILSTEEPSSDTGQAMYSLLQSLTDEVFEIADDGFFDTMNPRDLRRPPVALSKMLFESFCYVTAVNCGLILLVKTLPNSIGDSRARYVRHFFRDSVIVTASFPLFRQWLVHVCAQEYEL